MVFFCYNNHLQPENCLTSYEPHGYCVIYSSADRDSFILAERILQSLWTSENIAQRAVILVGNKADLARSRSITSEGMFARWPGLAYIYLVLHLCDTYTYNLLDFLNKTYMQNVRMKSYCEIFNSKFPPSHPLMLSDRTDCFWALFCALFVSQANNISKLLSLVSVVRLCDLP